MLVCYAGAGAANGSLWRSCHHGPPGNNVGGWVGGWVGGFVVVMREKIVGLKYTVAFFAAAIMVPW